MNKLAKIIESASQDELNLIRRDLVEGNIEKLINKRLVTFEQGGEAFCPICHSDVDQNNDIVLIFGPKGLRKKAIFCAYDCMEYFLHKLKIQVK